jgi:hypothetical protein
MYPKAISIYQLNSDNVVREYEGIINIIGVKDLPYRKCCWTANYTHTWNSVISESDNFRLINLHKIIV